MRVSGSMQVQAPIELVWSIVSEPQRQLDFMYGITRWEIESDIPSGLGARYRMLMRIGSAEVGGLIEIVEFSPPCDLAWTSVTGVDQRGRWRLRTRHGGRTHVELRLAYGVAGSGISGWVAERVAAPVMGSHIRRSLEQLRRLVEQEQRRAGADARRSATAA